MDTMVGTLTPEQMAQIMAQQQALTAALRDDPQIATQTSQQSTPQVVSATGGMKDLAGSLGGIANQANNQNWSTALRYGTTPGSQQSAMIAAQNAGL